MYFFNQTDSRKSARDWRQCNGSALQGTERIIQEDLQTVGQRAHVLLVTCWMSPMTNCWANSITGQPTSQTLPEHWASGHSLYMTCSFLPSHFAIIPLAWMAISSLPPGLLFVLYSSILISLLYLSQVELIVYMLRYIYSFQLMSPSKFFRSVSSC